MDADSTLALLSGRVLRDELLSLLDVGEQLRNRLLDQLRFELNSFADAEVLLDAIALKAERQEITQEKFPRYEAVLLQATEAWRSRRLQSRPT